MAIFLFEKNVSQSRKSAMVHGLSTMNKPLPAVGIIVQPVILYFQYLFNNIAGTPFAAVKRRNVFADGFYLFSGVCRANGQSYQFHRFQVGNVVTYIKHFLG